MNTYGNTLDIESQKCSGNIYLITFFNILITISIHHCTILELPGHGQNNIKCDKKLTALTTCNLSLTSVN